MKYSPKELDGNVNISHVSPLREFFLLMGGLLVIAIAFYVLLGFAVNKAVDWMPPEAETGLGEIFARKFIDDKRTEQEESLQELLEFLLKSSSLPGKDYKIHVFDSPQINAAALPGRSIIVFRGLINAVGSENELAFVIAHEIGHFANRDHLRGLGRGLVMLAISVAMLGRDNPASEFMMNSIVKAEMKFSQKQELAADLYAIKLLNKSYGHVGGADDFLTRLSGKDKMSKLRYYFASHPHPEIRIAELKGFIKNNNLLKREKKVLDDQLKGEKK